VSFLEFQNQFNCEIDPTLSHDVQSVVEDRPKEFMAVAKRLLDSEDGIHFVEFIDKLDFSEIEPVSIEHNELYLAFRNCKMPKRIETIVEKAASLAASAKGEVENGFITNFMGVDHVLKATILRIVFDYFESCPIQLVSMGLSIPRLIHHAIESLDSAEVSLDILVWPFSINPDACIAYLRNHLSVDYSVIIELLENSGAFKLYEILVDRHFEFSDDFLKDFIFKIRERSDLLVFIRNHGKDLPLLDLYMDDHLSQFMRDNSVFQAIVN
jgi:hypothetical protein